MKAHAEVHGSFYFAVDCGADAGDGGRVRCWLDSVHSELDGLMARRLVVQIWAVSFVAQI